MLEKYREKAYTVAEKDVTSSNKLMRQLSFLLRRKAHVKLPIAETKWLCYFRGPNVPFRVWKHLQHQVNLSTSLSLVHGFLKSGRGRLVGR